MWHKYRQTSMKRKSRKTQIMVQLLNLNTQDRQIIEKITEKLLFLCLSSLSRMGQCDHFTTNKLLINYIKVSSCKYSYLNFYGLIHFTNNFPEAYAYVPLSVELSLYLDLKRIIFYCIIICSFKTLIVIYCSTC